jgi:cytochrome c553
MRVLKFIAVGFAILVSVLAVAFLYFRSVALERLAKRYELAAADVPIPMPPKAAAADGGVQPSPEAELAAAVERGRHYVNSRAACTECHSPDLSGKVLIDSPVMGRWVAPNISGDDVKQFTGRDWVRLIRHGIKPDGTPSTMPSTDFTWFSDQEISDIAAYVRSRPKVERTQPPIVLGPIYAVMLANGVIPISAEVIDHDAPRPAYPPALEPSLELGKHLATTCTGCHAPNFSGGPISGGDPDWPPAQNITFHPSGIGGWTLADFKKALREGVRKDGSRVKPPMPVAYTKNLADAEIEALYVYLKQQPPAAYGVH